jgi:nitroreductase
MVRSFTDEPVPVEALERILDLARRGPSAGYSQGVEFVLVVDAQQRAELSAFEGRGGGSGVPNFVAQAPAVIVVCTSAEMYRSRYREADKLRIRRDWPDADFWLVPYWYVDAGAAMMLVLLGAVNEGLGAGVAGVMGAEEQERLRAVLGIPDDFHAVAMVAIGHEASNARAMRGSAATRRRRRFSDVVHIDRW